MAATGRQLEPPRKGRVPFCSRSLWSSPTLKGRGSMAGPRGGVHRPRASDNVLLHAGDSRGGDALPGGFPGMLDGLLHLHQLRGPSSDCRFTGIPVSLQNWDLALPQQLCGVGAGRRLGLPHSSLSSGPHWLPSVPFLCLEQGDFSAC